MSAVMIVSLSVDDPAWMHAYFEAVPELLAEYGGVTLAGSRRIARIEGEGAIPDRMAVMRFPSVEAIEAFMADARYRPYRDARQAGARAQIFAFENGVTGEGSL